MNCTDVATLSPLYISGELDSQRAAEVAAHLKSCSRCAGEIERQRELDALLRESVLAAEVNPGAVDQRVREQMEAATGAQRRSSASRWMLVAAGVVIALVAAGLGYRAFVRAQPDRLYADAARDHRFEVILRQPRRWHTEPAEIGKLAERQGVTAEAVAALAPAGYRAEHGKLCRLNGRIFLHLVYTDGAHEFSVFLREREAAALPGQPRETVNGRSLHAADVGGEHLGCFDTDRLRAMVVTDQPGEAALALARRIAATL